MRGDCGASRPTRSGFCGCICGIGRCAARSFAVSIRSGRTSLISARLSDGLSSSSTGRSISRDREKMKSAPRFSNRKAIECFDSGIARCLRVWRRFLARSTSFFVVRKLDVTERNPDSRAKKARCTRTLTFILSLTGKGNRNPRNDGFCSLRRPWLSPLPVRERMKVRVRVQRAFVSARIEILSFRRPHIPLNLHQDGLDLLCGILAEALRARLLDLLFCRSDPCAHMLDQAAMLRLGLHQSRHAACEGGDVDGGDGRAGALFAAGFLFFGDDQDFEEAGLHEPHQSALHLRVVAFELFAHYSCLLSGEPDRVELTFKLMPIVVDASVGDLELIVRQPFAQLQRGMHRAFAEKLVELRFQVPRHPFDLPGLWWKRPKRHSFRMSGGFGFFRGFLLHPRTHQYLRGRATPAGEGKLYSTTSTPAAVSFANQVSPVSPSSSSNPKSRR